MSSNTSDDEVFEYSGNGQIVPKDVVSVRFHPSVVKVDNEAFCRCSDLREVAFNEGLKKIGKRAFEKCESLERISFPSTVTEIDDEAFACSVSSVFYKWKCVKEVVLNEGLEKIVVGISI